MKCHELKTWSEHFDAISEGRKTFELRKNDRDFNVGDILELMEYDPVEQKYVVESEGDIINRMYVKVTHILRGGQMGLSPDFDILSIKHIDTDN